MPNKRHGYMPSRRTRVARRRGCLRLFISLMLMTLGIAIGVLVLGKLQSYRRQPVVDYAPIITQYAQEYGLEPAYIAAVIMAESSYRPTVVSSADARGLMQILPSTAEWIAGKLNEEYNEGALFDPETNIRFGAWYLDFLMDRYGGNKKCASAAYHAGQGTVDSWLDDPLYSKDGETLDVIAYSSTDTYVNRVLKYYEQYIPIYQEM